MAASNEDNPVSAFAAWIKSKRERHGWSQAACARKAGRTPQQWHNLETRTIKPHLETVALIARVLEAPTTEAMAAAGYVRESSGDIPADKALAIARAAEGLKRLDLPAIEEIAEFIAFKVTKKRAADKAAR